jgi:hypothetical protein
MGLIAKETFIEKPPREIPETGFHFDEDSHTYSLDGRRLISTTQAISILDDRPKVDRQYLERGRLVHFATELYDRGHLDESIIDDDVRGRLEAYIKFRKDTGFEPVYIEHPLFHPEHFYAGRIDRVGILNNWQDLIDIKSGVKARIDELQAIAYWELCRANSIPIKKQFDLYLKENGTYRLEPVEHRRSLLPVFLAALTVTRWKEGL